jgi:hypothetical protein
MHASLYAYCRRCRAVYDFLALYKGRHWRARCPECGFRVYAPSPTLLALIRQRNRERKKP